MQFLCFHTKCLCLLHGEKTTRLRTHTEKILFLASKPWSHNFEVRLHPPFADQLLPAFWPAACYMYAGWLKPCC